MYWYQQTGMSLRKASLSSLSKWVFELVYALVRSYFVLQRFETAEIWREFRCGDSHGVNVMTMNCYYTVRVACVLSRILHVKSINITGENELNLQAPTRLGIW